jgi:hypothetical protein
MNGKLDMTCFKYSLESPQQLGSVFNELLVGKNREDIWFGNRRNIIRDDNLVQFYLFVKICFLRREAAKFKVSKECAKATFCVRMILKEAKKIKVLQ